MNFHIITLFPKAFSSYLGVSILKRAIEDKKIKVSFYNPRDFIKNKWKRVDRPPYGGGPGLVIEALPVIEAIESAIKKSKLAPRTKPLVPKIIFLSPRGKQFDNTYASKIAKKYKNVIVVCGRYEGIDARIKKIFKMEEVSVGPFVLTGGELPAMIMMDVISRQVPGVLGNIDSLEERRVASSEVYTRPEVFEYKGKKYRVPKVLLSGHQAKIEEWKKKRP
jgi:tRNA (guanine37-N1)-methyltransferase